MGYYSRLRFLVLCMMPQENGQKILINEPCDNGRDAYIIESYYKRMGAEQVKIVIF